MLDQIAKGLLGAGSKLTGLAKGLDPMSIAVDTLCGAVGLPPAVANVVKIGVGAATGNVVMAASGAIDLTADALSNGGGKTELGMKAGIESQFKAGWSPFGGLQLESRHRAEFDLGLGIKLPDLTLASLVKNTFGCLLPLPLLPFPMGPPLYSILPAPIFGPPVFGSPPPRYNENSHLDPQILEYRDALNTLQQNYRTFDAAGRLDGCITDRDLRAITCNEFASPKLKKAAQFLLDHPEYKNRVDGGGVFAPVDGAINRWDISAELGRVNFDIARYGVRPPEGAQPAPGAQPGGPSGPVPTPPPGNGSPPVQGREPGIGEILRDPTLSLEDKIMMILRKIMDSLEEDLNATMGEMGAKYDEKKTIQDSKGEDKEGKLTKNASEMEKLQFKLQSLTEKRKQMFDLMSNMSMKFNEMSKTAIQNLARA